MRKLLTLFLAAVMSADIMGADVEQADDIALHVADIVVDWSGGGGTKDIAAGSFTYKQYASNYWDIHDLSTEVYNKIDFTFAQAVNYKNIYVTATYSDESKTEQAIAYGATSHTLAFARGKTLVRITIWHGWDGPGQDVTLFFGSIIIHARNSTGNISGMPVKSPKLGTGMANPILDFMFCADPTAIEHDGRLYVYGTNDHQQYDEGAEKNTYEKIKTLVMMSTDDMVNWTYHGLIPVSEIAPWIQASWAPSIISRQQADGTTLFSLYFSNSGWGTGVIQATSPVGPWTSPLSHSLIDGSHPAVKGSDAVFDPGAVVDEDGQGWLSFGGGQGWIARLNPDLHSFATDPVRLRSPFHFEANELNYINGTYVYTYNNDWSAHEPWSWGGTAPTACSMCYFKSKTPLDTDSWTYGGYYFKNPGENGMSYSNNHTHLHKFKGKWYLFYQTVALERALGSSGGFRSILVDEIEVDETNVSIKECIPTYKGVTATKDLNPLTAQYAATAAATLGIRYLPTAEPGHMVASVGTTSITAPAPKEGFIEVRNVRFPDNVNAIRCLLKGDGSVSLRIDDRNSADVVTLVTTDTDWQQRQQPFSQAVTGVHTIYLILRGDVQLDTWQLADTSSDGIGRVKPSASASQQPVYDLSGCRVKTQTAKRGIYIRNGRKVCQ